MRDISLHILDIMQNSTAAKSTLIKVTVQAETRIGLLSVVIEDNGCGMDEELLSVVTNPFSTTRTTRKVGLGIPLFKASAEQSGGSFRIASGKGIGTVVTSGYMIDHIDRPPLGDVSGVITDMAAAYPDVEIQLVLASGNKQFKFNSREAAQKLEGVPLAEFAVVQWFREYIGEGIREIFGGVLNEIVG